MWYIESAIDEVRESTEGKYFHVQDINEDTNLMELAYEFIAETSEYENRLLEGVGKFEIMSLKETGEVVYTEAGSGTLWDKIKKLLIFIKDWVVAVWKRFVAWFDKFFKSDESFVKKYKGKITGNASIIKDDKEVEIGVTTGLLEDVSKYNSATVFDLSELSIAVKNFFSNMMNDVKYNKLILGGETNFNNDLDDYLKKIDDYEEEYFKKTTVKADWLKNNANTVIDILNIKSKDFKKVKEDSLKEIKNLENTINKIEKNDNKKLTNNMKIANKVISKYKSAVSKYSSYVMNSIKKSKSAARKLALAYINAKPLPKRESAFEHSDLDAYLDF